MKRQRRRTGPLSSLGGTKCRSINCGTAVYQPGTSFESLITTCRFPRSILHLDTRHLLTSILTLTLDERHFHSPPNAGTEPWASTYWPVKPSVYFVPANGKAPGYAGQVWPVTRDGTRATGIYEARLLWSEKNVWRLKRYALSVWSICLILTRWIVGFSLCIISPHHRPHSCRNEATEAQR